MEHRVMTCPCGSRFEEYVPQIGGRRVVDQMERDAWVKAHLPHIDPVKHALQGLDAGACPKCGQWVSHKPWTVCHWCGEMNG